MTEILNVQQAPDNNQYLLEKRFELLLDLSNKKLLKEITEIRDAVVRLEGEIRNLKSSQRSAVTVQKTLAEQPEPKQTVPLPNQIPQPSAVSSSEQKINPSDFSIEKYFYFGKK